MALAVVLDDLWMVDRDVGRTGLEVVHRIPALGHHRLDQLVRRRDGGGRAVHELRLNRLPLVRVALPRRARQRPDLELLAPLLARGELGLRGSLVVGRSDRPFVFRAEVTPELLAPTPPPRSPTP